MIDITTAATLRPEILERTYWSFTTRLFKNYPCRLFLNVDPVGDDHTADDVVAVAKKYFDVADVRVAEKPGFPEALIWLYNQVESDLFFNLEDDWELMADMNFGDMMKPFHVFPDLALLRFVKRWSTDYRAAIYDDGHKIGVWNGYYYEHSFNRYSGMPSLIRKEFIKEFVKHMKPGLNHERLSAKLTREEHPAVAKWKYGAFSRPGLPVCVRNIGVRWRNQRKLIKRWHGPNWEWEVQNDS